MGIVLRNANPTAPNRVVRKGVKTKIFASLVLITHPNYMAVWESYQLTR